MKRQCKGCGYGGDWAFLLDVKQRLTPDTSAGPDLPDTDTQPKRISVMFYVADERNGPIEVQIGELKGPSGEGSGRVLQGGHGASQWQLRAASSSKRVLTKLALTKLCGRHTPCCCSPS